MGRGVSALVEWVCENWDQPDEGVWETRGGRKNFLYSRLMCWVAIERAIRVATRAVCPPTWSAGARPATRSTGGSWSAAGTRSCKAFVQHEDGDVLDASVLMMPLAKFIAPTDPKWLIHARRARRRRWSPTRWSTATTRMRAPTACAAKRAPSRSAPSGTSRRCTRAGRLDEARLAFEKMLTYANHLGLYAEEIGHTGEQLGNFPQAFTHLALISAAFNLDRALG